MDPAGVGADLGAGEVTFEEACGTQPFGDVADGGDGFTRLRLGTARQDTAGDHPDAFVACLEAHSPASAPATGRITVAPQVRRSSDGLVPSGRARRRAGGG